VTTVLSNGFGGVGTTMGSIVFPFVPQYLLDWLFFCSQHAGAPSTSLKGIPAIPVSVFAVAVQEYEENSETDDKGDMLY
jgi:hypothetical protein